MRGNQRKNSSEERAGDHGVRQVIIIITTTTTTIIIIIIITTIVIVTFGYPVWHGTNILYLGFVRAVASPAALLVKREDDSVGRVFASSGESTV